MVGKLDPALFPHVFGPDGDEPLDADGRARASSRRSPTRSRRRPGTARTPEEIADGFLEIAVENMANAIKHISVERGYDVTEYTLCCFGGAGGQHACLVADALGMTRVFIHPLAGVLSAYGMGLADVRALRQQAVEAGLDEASLAAVSPTYAALEAAARDDVAKQGIPAERIGVPADAAREVRGDRHDARGAGRGRCAPIVAEFERRYAQQYGFLMPGKALVIEAVAVEAVGRTESAGDGCAGVRAARGRARDASRTQPRLHGRRVPRRGGLRARGPAAGRRDRRPGDRHASRTRRPSSSRAGGRR